MQSVAVGVQTVEQRQVALAGNAEGQLGSVDDELVGQHLAAQAGAGHLATEASDRGSSTKIRYSCSLGLSASSSRT